MQVRIDVLKRTRGDDEQTGRQPLSGNRANEWHEIIGAKITVLDNMKCWEAIERPEDERILHKRFVLKWEVDVEESITR